MKFDFSSRREKEERFLLVSFIRRSFTERAICNGNGRLISSPLKNFCLFSRLTADRSKFIRPCEKEAVCYFAREEERERERGDRASSVFSEKFNSSLHGRDVTGGYPG